MFSQTYTTKAAQYTATDIAVRCLITLVMLLALHLLLTAPAYAAQQKIGVVGSLKSNVSAVGLDGIERGLNIGDAIYFEETIRTNKAGQAQLIFLDKSTLSVGANAELMIDKFVYDPVTKDGEMSINGSKGMFRFIGGALSKKQEVKLKTPVATIGIRGGIAQVEVAPNGQANATFLYGNSMSVQNAAGTQSVDKPGLTVGINGANSAPLPPVKMDFAQFAQKMGQLGANVPPAPVGNTGTDDNGNPPANEEGTTPTQNKPKEGDANSGNNKTQGGNNNTASNKTSATGNRAGTGNSPAGGGGNTDMPPMNDIIAGGPDGAGEPGAGTGGSAGPVTNIDDMADSNETVNDGKIADGACATAADPALCRQEMAKLKERLDDNKITTGDLNTIAGTIAEGGDPTQQAQNTTTTGSNTGNPANGNTTGGTTTADNRITLPTVFNQGSFFDNEDPANSPTLEHQKGLVQNGLDANGNAVMLLDYTQSGSPDEGTQYIADFDFSGFGDDAFDAGTLTFTNVNDATDTENFAYDIYTSKNGNMQVMQLDPSAGDFDIMTVSGNQMLDLANAGADTLQTAVAGREFSYYQLAPAMDYFQDEVGGGNQYTNGYTHDLIGGSNSPLLPAGVYGADGGVGALVDWEHNNAMSGYISWDYTDAANFDNSLDITYGKINTGGPGFGNFKTFSYDGGNFGGTYYDYETDSGIAAIGTNNVYGDDTTNIVDGFIINGNSENGHVFHQAAVLADDAAIDMALDKQSTGTQKGFMAGFMSEYTLDANGDPIAAPAYTKFINVDNDGAGEFVHVTTNENTGEIGIELKAYEDGGSKQIHAKFGTSGTANVGQMIPSGPIQNGYFSDDLYYSEQANFTINDGGPIDATEGHGVAVSGSLADVTQCTTCDYVSWGVWGANMEYYDGSNDIQQVANLIPYVHGTMTEDLGSMASSIIADNGANPIANYSGIAVGHILNNGNGELMAAQGDFHAVVNFTNKQVTDIAIENFNGYNFGATGVAAAIAQGAGVRSEFMGIQNDGANTYYSNNASTLAANEATFNGAFFGPLAEDMAGNFAFDDATNNKQGTGIFMGSR